MEQKTQTSHKPQIGSWLNQNWVTVLIAIIGAIGTTLGYLSDTSKSYSENNQVLIDNFTNQLNTLTLDLEKQRREFNQLNADLTECGISNVKLQIENGELKTDLLLSNADLNDIPNPIWIKSLNGKMLYVNDSYEKVILRNMGKSKADYIGIHDSVVWGKVIADEYRKNDLEVIRDMKTIDFRESIKVDGNTITYLGKKYPILTAGKIVAVGGIINKIEE